MNSFSKLKVVCLGGGNGLSTLLSGLKHLSVHSPLRIQGQKLTLNDITGIVTVSDDGGSSGRIRQQYKTPAPGDIRNCLLALASDQTLMSRLFSYRFSGVGELSNHSLGNLLLTALADITGDFHQAIQLSSHILAVEGQILPSTTENVILRARMKDGSMVAGETRIRESNKIVQEVYLDPSNCKPLPEALEALTQADLIVVGPGSLYTSLLPNLLVRDLQAAFLESSAVRIYVGNLMTEAGETDHFKASEHLRVLLAHCGREKLFHAALFNNQVIPEDMVERYRTERAEPVGVDEASIHDLGVTPYQYPLLSLQAKARHDPVKLAEAIVETLKTERNHVASR